MFKRLFLISIIILIILLSLVLSAYASSLYGFESIKLSENEINQIWDKLNIKNLSTNISLDDINLPIISFDVSDEEMIILGFKNNQVIIIDKNKIIQTYLEFSNNGLFYVQWKKNNILLYLVRGGIIVELTSNGQLINMIKTDDNNINNNFLWNEISKKTNIDIDNSTYIVKNDMGILNIFTSSYSQLVKINSNGETVIIYNINNTQLTKIIILVICAVLFIVLTISTISIKIIKFKRH